MSLLDDFSEKYYLMNEVRTSDGEGGFSSSYVNGVQINLALRHDTSVQAKRAEHEGVTSTITFLCPKNVTLKFHDVVKRVSDGAVFRITSLTGESITPDSSSLNLTSVSAERWVIPS